MAGIDVNDVLVDMDLSTVFDVRRRHETVNDKGRTRIVDEMFPGQRGVITWEDGAINRNPDGSIAQEHIKIVTPFSLRDTSMGFQADVIIWNGAEYTITSSKANRHFGRGFTRATASSRRATDSPPPMGNVP